MMTHGVQPRRNRPDDRALLARVLAGADGTRAGRSTSSRRRGAGVRARSRRRRLRDGGAVPRAVLRRGGVRDVPEPARRARGLGHRAGVPTCVRALSVPAVATAVARRGAADRRVAAGAGAAEPAAAAAGTPDRAEIARAIDEVKADPNLATERTIKTLRWKQSAASKPSRMPGWLRGSPASSRWLEQSARVLVWVRGRGAGCGCSPSTSRASLRTRRRRRRSRGRSSRRRTCATWTSGRRRLPDDIGAAARALWDRGEQRAALALLYRGMLSRLAHVHRVPIRDSSTEGDCLALAARAPAATTGASTPRASCACGSGSCYGRAGRRGRRGLQPVRRVRRGARSRSPRSMSRCSGARHDARRDSIALARRRLGWRCSSSGSRSHTYWEDITVPMPPKGEALINPFYAAQRFAEALGATHDVGSRCSTVPSRRRGDRASPLALEPERGRGATRSSAGSNRADGSSSTTA